MSDDSELGSVLAALSAAVVDANQFLRNASRVLDDGEAGLLPSFAIAEASFELAFVVDRVEEKPPEIPPLPVRRPVSIGDRERASLLRAASPDAAAALDDLLAGYRVLKELYEQVRARPASAGDLEIPPDVRPPAVLLAELRTGASATAVAALDRLLADYDATRADLLEIRRIVRAGPQRRVLVRIDPGAIRDAGAAVQHVRLALRVGSQEIIDVDGDRVAVPG